MFLSRDCIMKFQHEMTHDTCDLIYIQWIQKILSAKHIYHIYNLYMRRTYNMLI